MLCPRSAPQPPLAAARRQTPASHGSRSCRPTPRSKRRSRCRGPVARTWARPRSPCSQSSASPTANGELCESVSSPCGPSSLRSTSERQARPQPPQWWPPSTSPARRARLASQPCTVCASRHGFSPTARLPCANDAALTVRPITTLFLRALHALHLGCLGDGTPSKQSEGAVSALPTRNHRSLRVRIVLSVAAAWQRTAALRRRTFILNYLDGGADRIEQKMAIQIGHHHAIL